MRQQIGIHPGAGISFVSTSQGGEGTPAGRGPPAEVEAVTSDYAQAQLQGLKIGILTAGALVLGSFPLTRHLPARRLLAAGRTEAVLAEAGSGPGGPGD